MKTAEQNFDWLDRQVDGLLNDFEGGESTLQETKNGFYEIIFDKLIKQIQEQQDYKQEIDEACKKQREICADAFMTKEDYLYIKLNTPDTISTLKRDEILNAPSPKESE